MGHAGAIIEGNMGTSHSKMVALREVGVDIARYPVEVVDLVRKNLAVS